MNAGKSMRYVSRGTYEQGIGKRASLLRSLVCMIRLRAHLRVVNINLSA